MKNSKTKPISDQRIVSNWIYALGFIILSFILYGNTLGHKYCLDDAIVITQNDFTKRGFEGISDIFTNESFTGFFGKQKELVSGARYRPLSIATFAVEWQFLKENPSVSHFINILLYGLTAFFIFLLLNWVIKNNEKQYWLHFLPLMASLLFLFHPVHTEVVANIKGRDEILALFFSVSACYCMVRFHEFKKIKLLICGAVLWFLALLSKENAIVFWLLMPLLLYIRGEKEIKRYLLPVLAFSIMAIIFLWIRQSVIGASSGVSNELMNNSFLHATSSQHYATIFYTLWKYVVLLFYPATLTFDYYPYHIALTGWNNIWSVLGLSVYGGIIVYVLFYFKKNLLITLAFLVYLLPLIPVSNLFFPIGTFMNERFIYFSSLGFCILVAYGLSFLLSKNSFGKYSVYGLLTVVLLFFTLKTISRNKVWYNDYTLFTHDVVISANSAKSNCSAGGALLESTDTITDIIRKESVLNRSIHYLHKAITIHPRYFDAWLLLGNAYFKKGNNPDSALWCYSNILDLNPDHDLAFKNALALANNQKDVDIKIKILEKLELYRANDFQVNYLLGENYGKGKNDLDKSILYLAKAMKINPNSKDVYIDLGVAYGLKSNFSQSAEMLLKASELDPTDAAIYLNLGLTYQNLGQLAKASECFKKAEGLKKGK